MILEKNNPFTILITFQYFTIIAGTILTMGHLKVWGYSESPLELPEFSIIHYSYNPVAIFVRNWGIIALLIPAALHIFMLSKLRKSNSKNHGKEDVALSILLLIGLIIFYTYTTLTAVTSH